MVTSCGCVGREVLTHKLQSLHIRKHKVTLSGFTGFAGAAALSLLVAGTANAATLDGRSFTLDYLIPDMSTVYLSTNGPIAGTVTAGPGVDAAIEVEGVTTISLDFDGNMLKVLLNTILNGPEWNTAPFNGIRISFAGTPGFDAFSMTDNSFGPITPSFSGSTLFLNWPGAAYVDGSTATFEVSLAPIPLPAALPLLATALAGGAGFAKARRRRKSMSA